MCRLQVIRGQSRGRQRSERDLRTDGCGRLGWEGEPAISQRLAVRKARRGTRSLKCHGSQRRKTLKEKVPETMKSLEE